MTRFFAAFLIALPLAGPALAMGDSTPPPEQQAPAPVPPPPAQTAPADDLGAGIEDFMRNMLTEAQPQLDNLGDDLGALVGKISPVLSDIGKLMDDAGNYQRPERLENGDIIIRRRADAPPPPPVGPALQDMMRPNRDAPAAPDAPQPLPQSDPASQIDL